MISLFKNVWFYLKQMKPLFWGVSVAPFYIAWAIGSNKPFPTYISRLFFIPETAPVQDPMMEMLIFLVGLLAIGPFLGGSTILYNDYWDYATDRGNRRKTDLPLLKGLLKPRSVLIISIILALLAVITAVWISLLFASFVLICVILSIVYSTPPVRLKERPGLDLTTNVIGSGLVCSFAGWVVVAPLSEFPVIWGITVMFGVGAIYMPTTIIDYEPDKMNKVKTIAQLIGKRSSYHIGVLCIGTADLLILCMCFFGYIVDMGFLLYAIPISVIQMSLYTLLLRRLDFTGGYLAILFLAILLAIGNTLTIFYHAGILVNPF